MPLNASELLITLTGPAHLPLRVRLAGALRDAIRSGQLGGGTTLPSTRVLAQQSWPAWWSPARTTGVCAGCDGGTDSAGMPSSTPWPVDCLTGVSWEVPVACI